MMLLRVGTRHAAASTTVARVLPISTAALPLFSRGALAGSARILSSDPAAGCLRSLTTASVPERPLSPHVSIYRFPLPALTSITTRATGAALTVGVYAAGGLALFGSQDLSLYVDGFKAAAPLLVEPTKFLISFPFVYHSLAGVRHLYWDYTTKGLSLPEVYRSSYALIGATALFTLGLTFFSF